MRKSVLISLALLLFNSPGHSCSEDNNDGHSCHFQAELKQLDKISIEKIQKEIDYDSYDFHSPLDVSPILAANFGELRTNHFHTGLDFKTNRREGYKIYSIDDGYVSRIKVSPWGYGHVVYIDHYNGLTSVYAHCSYFQGEIAKLAETQQKKSQLFEIDYYPPRDSLKVKKGEVIALSGNTGGSTAPHLHFEIRDTKSEYPLNPLLFGFGIKDDIPPEIRAGRVYAVTNEGYRVPNFHKDFSIYGNKGNYAINGGQIKLSSDYIHKNGGIGLAFDAIDKLNAANNVCGIHEAILIVDKDTIYHQNMSELSFASNRFINVHKDYEAFHQRRKHLQKTFKTKNNPLPIYHKLKNRGIISIQPGERKKVVYSCLDAHGNKSSLSFDLIIDKGAPNASLPFDSKKLKYLTPDSAYMKIGSDYSILFPPKIIYEPTPLIIKKQQDKLYFGNSRIPLQDKYRVMLKMDETTLPSEKYFIERTNHKNRNYYEEGLVKDGWITTWTKDFGSFSVKSDTLAPTIIYKNFRNGQKITSSQLVWKFKDESSGVKHYRLFINGDYQVLKYEYKRGGKYYFEVPSEFKGKKKLKVEVSDACNNVAVEEYEVEF